MLTFNNCRAGGFRDTENVTLTYAAAHDHVELGVQSSPEIVDSRPQRIDEVVNLFVEHGAHSGVAQASLKRSDTEPGAHPQRLRVRALAQP